MRTIPPHPRKISPRLGLGFGSRLGVTFRVGGQPDNCPWGKLSPVSVRGWVRVSFGVEGQFSSEAIVLEPFKLNPLCDNKTAYLNKIIWSSLSCEFRESVESTYLVKHFDRHKMTTGNDYPLSETSVLFELGITEGA